MALWRRVTTSRPDLLASLGHAQGTTARASSGPTTQTPHSSMDICRRPAAVLESTVGSSYRAGSSYELGRAAAAVEPTTNGGATSDHDHHTESGQETDSDPEAIENETTVLPDLFVEPNPENNISLQPTRTHHHGQSSLRTRCSRVCRPGTRKLHRRLVVSFALLSIFGFVLLVLGAVFLEEAREISEENGNSLPMIWCIISIVSGAMMLAASIILGKMMISRNLRLSQRASYRNRNSGNRGDGQQEVDLDLPPPYRQSENGTASIYIISGDDVNVTIAPPGSVTSPPDYEEVVLTPPPEYSASDRRERGEISAMVSAPTQADSEPAATMSEANLPPDPPTYRQSVGTPVNFMNSSDAASSSGAGT